VVLSIPESGNLTFATVWAGSFGQMDLNTKVIGLKIKPMEGVSFSTLMGMFMKASGMMIRLKARVLINIKMAQFTQEIGLMIYNTATVLKRGQKEVHTKANMSMARKMGVVSISGETAPPIPGPGKLTKLKVRESTPGSMAGSTTDNGRTTRCMGAESTDGLTDVCMMENIIWTRSTAKVFITGPMVGSIAAGGRMVNNMASVSTTYLMM